MDKKKILNDGLNLIRLGLGALGLLRDDLKKELKNFLKANDAKNTQDIKDPALHILGFNLSENIELIGLKIEDIEEHLEELDLIDLGRY